MTDPLPADRVSQRTTIVGLCVLLAHGPLLCVHLAHLWARPHFQFVGLLLPLVGWLMWQRWPRGRAYVPARRLEQLLLFGSLGILTAGIWLNSPYLAAVSSILAVGFLIVHRAGAVAMGTLLPAWMLLWFAVPPPLGYDLIIVSSMQSTTSQLASLLLDLLSIDHLMAGNVLQMGESSFFVDEACSGVHSLFALLATTAVSLVVVSRGMLRSTTLIFCSVGWALFANVLRVCSIAAAMAWWHIDLSSGWVHEVLGVLTFVFALGLSLSTDRWLHFVEHVGRRCLRSARDALVGSPDVWPVASTTIAERHHAQLQELNRSRIPRPSAVLGFVAISTYSLLFVADVAGLSPTERAAWKVNPLLSVTADRMPATCGAMELRSFERVERDFSSDFGRTSCVWTYAGGDLGTLRVALDGSFSGWHELTRCYAGQGWRVAKRRVVENENASWVEATLTKPTGEHACLLYTLVSLSGRVLDPAAGEGVSRLIDRVREEQSVQVQVLAECGGEVDDVLHREATHLLQTALNRCKTNSTAAPSAETSERDNND